MNDKRLMSVFSSAVEKSLELNLILGRLGKLTGTDTYTFEVPGKPGWVYVSLGADGNGGQTIAHNLAGASLVGFQNVRMRREHGHLVIRDADHLNMGASSLSGLSDFNVTNPLDGQYLRYDDLTGKWINTDADEVVTAMDDLSDVTLAGLTTNQILVWNGSAWVNQNQGATHDPVTAGNGIVISGSQVVNIDLVDSNPGLEFVGGDLQLGSPTTITVSTANSKSGAGHTHEIDETNNAHVNPNKILSADSQGRLIVRSLGIYGNLDFGVAAPEITNTAGSLTLKPSGALLVQPGTNLVEAPNAVEWKSVSIDDTPLGIEGWRISSSGLTSQLTIGRIKADELFVRFFTADETRVQRGENMIARTFGIVETAFDIPADEATVEVWFEAVTDTPDANLFMQNEWVTFRTIDTESGLTVMNPWFTVVDAAPDAYKTNDDGIKCQRWTLKRESGGLLNATIHAGAVGVGVGHPKSGDTINGGIIYLTAIPDGRGGVGPAISTGYFDSIDTVADKPDFTFTVRMGNLNGAAGVTSNRWGIAIGDDLSLSPNSGFSGLTATSDKGLSLYNTDFEIYEAADVQVKIGKDIGISLQVDDSYFGLEKRDITWYDDLTVANSLTPPVGRLGVYKSGNSPIATLMTFTSVTGAIPQVHLSATSQSEGSSYIQLLGGSGAAANRINLTSGRVFVYGEHSSLMVGAYDSLHSPTSNIHSYESNTDTGESGGIMIEQAGAGDSLLHWLITDHQAFTAGIDNSDGYKWKLSIGYFLDSPIMVVNPADGSVVINGLDLSGGSGVTGLTSGDGSISISGTDLTVNPAMYVTTGREIATTGGLTGGGTLGTNLTLGIDSSIARSNIILTAGNGLTGGGNLTANRSFAVVTGTGITIVANAVSIDENAALDWTGAHSFSSTFTLATNLTFSGSRFINTNAGSSITIQPDVNLNLSPGSKTIVTATKPFESSDFSPSGITGFQFNNNGAGNMQLSVHTLKANDIRATTLVYDAVRADIGDEWWGKSLGILHTRFKTPAATAGTVSVYFEDIPSMGAAPIFQNSDWIRFRILTAAGLSTDIWGQVSGYLHQGNDPVTGRGYQRWTFTLRSGPVNTWIEAGNVAVSFGASGQGYVHLSALEANNGPWIAMGDWTGANPYTPANQNLYLKFGNLKGSIGYLTETYGFATGNDLSLTAATGFSGLVADSVNGMRLFNADLFLYEGSDVAISITGDEGIDILPETITGYSARGSITWTDVGYIQGRYDVGGNPLLEIVGNPDTLSGDNAHITIGQDLGGGSEARIDILSYAGVNALDSYIHIDAPNINLGLNTLVWGLNHDGIQVGADFIPTDDVAYDLGSASKRWHTVHAVNVNVDPSGVISGNFGGPLWEYEGNITIDATGTVDRTVNITNSDTGGVTLAVAGNITVTGTIDGVDLSVHAADPDAHHDTASGSGAIAVSGSQVVSLTLATNSGLNQTSGLAISSSIAGNGLSFSAGVISVAVGSGIAIVSDSVTVDSSVARNTWNVNAGAGLSGGGALAAAGITLSINLAADSGLTTASGLALSSSIAGAGLVIGLDKVLYVGAGDGITVGADTVGVNSTVARDTWAVNAGSGLTGGGNLAAAGITLNIGAGDGIDVAADSIAVDVTDFIDTAYGLTEDTNNIRINLQSTGGLAFATGALKVLLPATSSLVTDATGLYLKNELAGSGLTLTNQVLHVQVKEGIEIDADFLRVDEEYNFQWTGDHDFSVGVTTFHTTPQINADLNFYGGNRSITSTQDITLSPGADLIIDPVGNIYLPDAQEMRSTTFNDLVTGIEGFRLFKASDDIRQLTIARIKAGEIIANTLVLDETRIDRGEEFWGTSYGIIGESFVIPVDEATVDVWFENAPALGTSNLFSVGDWLLVRTVDRTSGVNLNSYWFTVDSLLTAGSVDGESQQWRIKYESGGTVGDVIDKGVSVLDAGQVGSGWIHLSSLPSNGGPFFQLGEFTGVVASDAPEFTNRVRIGNLDGVAGLTGDRWGMAAGNDLSITPATGFSGFVIDGTLGLTLYNTDIYIEDSGNPKASLTSDKGLRFTTEGATGYYSLQRITWIQDIELAPVDSFSDSISIAGRAFGDDYIFEVLTNSTLGSSTFSVELDGASNTSFLEASSNADFAFDAKGPGVGFGYEYPGNSSNFYIAAQAGLSHDVSLTLTNSSVTYLLKMDGTSGSFHIDNAVSAFEIDYLGNIKTRGATTNASISTKGWGVAFPWLSVEGDNVSTVLLEMYALESISKLTSTGATASAYTNNMDSIGMNLMLSSSVSGSYGGNIILDSLNTYVMGFLSVGGGTPGYLTSSFSYPNGSTYAVAEVTGAQYGRMVVRGTSSSAIDFVDDGASANSKWIQLLSDGGTTRFRSLTDAGATLVDNILHITHSDGQVSIGGDLVVQDHIKLGNTTGTLALTAGTSAPNGPYIELIGKDAGGSADGDINIISTTASSARGRINFWRYNGTNWLNMLYVDPADNNVVIANGARYVGYGAKATNSNGFRLETSTGGLGLFLENSTGYIGVGTTAPGYATPSYSYNSSLVTMVQSGGQQYGRLMARGSIDAGLDLIDTGAGSSVKWMNLVTDGGYTKFRAITDAGSVLRDGIISMEHSTGSVEFNYGVTMQAGFIANQPSYISSGSLTAGTHVLFLQQVDASEEILGVSCAVGATNGISTAALGTYYGKMKVEINGAVKWIPLYN